MILLKRNFPLTRVFLLIIGVFAAGFSSRAADEQKLIFNLSVEPRTLDPGKAEGVPENQVIMNLVEGLIRTDDKGLPVPAIADKWEISPDQKVYTFHLRDAKWSNGEAVTAADFVFGWKRALAPETASQYAYQLFFVEGAEDYNAGKAKTADGVGVRAVSANTLVVMLKNPTPFFLSVLAHTAYFPVKESWLKAHPKCFAEPAEYLSNGAFTLAEWKHNDRIILKRNPNYYNAANVKLETLVMPMITNESTALLQWEAGKIDLDIYAPLPDVPRLKKEGKLKTSPYLGVYFVGFENKRKPFDNPKVRRAFSLAIDRKQITEALLRGGQLPAYALVPPGIEINGKDFRDSTGDLFKEDAAEAKRLLAEAGYPGGKNLPRIKYLFNDLEMHRTVGQALQNMWETTLGAKVDLEVQEWKVYLQNRQNHNYQCVRGGWIGDYVDPVTFFDMFATNSGNNDFEYQHADFDKLLDECKTTTDSVARLAKMQAAERKIIADDMAIAPIFFYVNQFFIKDYVKGVALSPLGGIYFSNARIEGR